MHTIISNRFQISLSIFSLFFILSCSSGKKSLERGDYANAVRTATERLKKSPSNDKAQETLAEAYPMALKYHLEQIRNLEMTTQIFKYEKIWEHFNVLNGLYEGINTCPACLKVISMPENFYAKTEQYKSMAAEDRFQAGVSEMATGTRERAKEAYRHFQKANFFVPNYKNSVQKMDEALVAATLKVIVEQPPTPARYSLSVDFFTNKMQESFFRRPPSEFVRFFSVAEAKSLNINRPDQIIIMQFDDFTVGETHTVERTNTLTKTVKKKVKEGEVEKEVEMEVKAEYTEFERNVLSKGMLDVRIIDAYSQQVLYNEKFPSQYLWTAFWANYKGDSDALSKEQLERSNFKPVSPPSQQYLFSEMCNNLYAQLTESLKQYYRKFD